MTLNVSKLLVLGALEQLGGGSGYDVLQELQCKMIHKWIDIKTGSIYYTLKQLQDAGAVHEIGQMQEGNYPTKAIFEVTLVGQQLFDDLQAEAFLGLFPRFYGFKVALKFNVRRSSVEIHAFAQQAVVIIDKHLAAMDTYLRTLAPDAPQRASDAFFIDHDRRLFEAEKAWIHAASETLAVHRQHEAAHLQERA